MDPVLVLLSSVELYGASCVSVREIAMAVWHQARETMPLSSVKGKDIRYEPDTPQSSVQPLLLHLQAHQSCGFHLFSRNVSAGFGADAIGAADHHDSGNGRGGLLR